MKVCPIQKIACSLWIKDGEDVNEKCLAAQAYEVLLDNFYPCISSLPLGTDSIRLRKSLQRCICKEVQSIMKYRVERVTIQSIARMSLRGDTDVPTSGGKE